MVSKAWLEATFRHLFATICNCSPLVAAKRYAAWHTSDVVALSTSALTGTTKTVVNGTTLQDTGSRYLLYLQCTGT